MRAFNCMQIIIEICYLCQIGLADLDGSYFYVLLSIIHFLGVNGGEIQQIFVGRMKYLDSL